MEEKDKIREIDQKVNNTAPQLAQIVPDLSKYQNPVSELYVRPS